MNAEPDGIDADQIDARFTQTRIADTRALSGLGSGLRRLKCTLRY
jgi:hypothetical protein